MHWDIVTQSFLNPLIVVPVRKAVSERVDAILARYPLAKTRTPGPLLHYWKVPYGRAALVQISKPQLAAG
jgi:hypothetical protein